MFGYNWGLPRISGANDPKTAIIYLFRVRFQIRLNHMKDLLILHVTKEKKKKYCTDAAK